MIRKAADHVEVEAIFTHGVFTPKSPVAFDEGQRVFLSIEPVSDSRESAGNELQGWRYVFEGLSDHDLIEIEPLILDRSRFLPDRAGGPYSPTRSRDEQLESLPPN